jgi:ribosomal protein L7/L12
MDKLPPEAVAALERGRLIDAIKIVRDRTGLDVKSAKEAVERYANRQEGPADWQEGDWGRGEPEAAAGMQGNGPASVPSAALAALAQGNKIEAIRLTREATGLDLAAAKQLVDSHENPALGSFGHLPSGMPSHPMAEPGRVPNGGRQWLPIVVVLLVVALAWLYFGGKV